MSEKCDTKIYSDFTYEKAREENLNRVSKYYQKILGDYTQAYSKYLASGVSTTGSQGPVQTPVPTGVVAEGWADLLAPTPSPSSNLEMDPAQQADQQDMANAVLRPKLMDLNNQLILVQKNILENNLKVKNTIKDQQKIITSDEAEIRRKEKLFKDLKLEIGKAKDQGKLGETRIGNETEKKSSIVFQYWFWLILDIIVLTIMIAIYATTTTLPKYYNSNTKPANNNTKVTNNTKVNNSNNKRV